MWYFVSKYREYDELLCYCSLATRKLYALRSLTLITNRSRHRIGHISIWLRQSDNPRVNYRSARHWIQVGWWRDDVKELALAVIGLKNGDESCDVKSIANLGKAFSIMYSGKGNRLFMEEDELFKILDAHRTKAADICFDKFQLWTANDGAAEKQCRFVHNSVMRGLDV